MTPEEKLRDLGIELPDIPAPLGSYVPCIQTGKLIFLSGILPLKNGKLTRTGRVGESISLDDAKEETKTATLNALSILKAYVGSLDNIKRCVKITGYVASSPDFIEQPKILNTASDLVFEIFGETGKHARSAIGVNVLPLNSTVELEFIFEV